jgi:uncharacterized protein (DUF927 family)
LRGFSDVSEFSGHLQENAATYYGTASIEFVKKVLTASNIKELYKEEFKRTKSIYLPENASGQDKRVFERCAFVGFTGELATKYGVTGWPAGEALSAALKCFNAWLESKGGVGDLEEKRVLEQTKAFFDVHVCGRFYDLDGAKDQKINNLAGYKREMEKELTFYATTSVFQNEICKGFNKDYAIKMLKEKKILLDYLQKWTPHSNKRVYVFDGKTLSEC